MTLHGWACIGVGDNVAPSHGALYFPMIDGGGNDPKVICEAVKRILLHWRNDEKVFVYCKHGMNRSALIAAAALAVSGRCEWLSTALFLVNRARPIATPRDDTMREVLEVVLAMRPAKPRHA